MDNEALQERLRYIVPQIRTTIIRDSSANNEPYCIETAGALEKLLEPLKYYSEEQFVVFHLNVRNQVTAYHTAAQGTVTETLVHPREVFKAAIQNNAVSIIVAHNHPGSVSTTTPSPEDISATVQLIQAGKTLGITVLDHIIAGAKGFCSIRQMRNDLWDSQSQGLVINTEVNKTTGKIQDFWLVYEIEKGLPKLIGDPDRIISAEAVRRKQIIDLITLKQLIADKAMYVMDQYPESDKKLLQEFGKAGVLYVEIVGNRERAEDWLSTSAIKYDWEWVQKGWIETWKEREQSASTYCEEHYQKSFKAYFNSCIMANQAESDQSKNGQQQIKVAA